VTEKESVREFQIAGVQVQVFDDKDVLGHAAASAVVSSLRRVIEQEGEATVIFATGASQYEFLAALIQMRDDIDWSRVEAFHLDEYLGISANHTASFRRYLRQRLFQHLPFESVHLLQGDAPDPEEECRRYAAMLGQRTVNVACIGIGENGHLAFNDPPADFDTPKLVDIVELDEACRQQQVGEGHFPALEDVPRRALTLTIPAILRAQVIRCVVPDARKAQAVCCSLEGPISPDCPGSALRTHNNVRLYLDADSASLLHSTHAGGSEKARP
jgi:glucosamine-6-phosphate deaminase